MAEPRAAGPGLLIPAAAVCAGAIGYALEISNGHVGDGSIFWLTIGLLAIATGLFATPSFRPPAASENGYSHWLLGALLFFQLYQLRIHFPAIHLVAYDARTLLPYRAGVSVAALVSVGLFSRRRGLSTAAFLTLIAIQLGLGIWLIKTSPDPLIDVYKIHRDSLNALLHGQNPYTLTFPNPYPNTIMYGPGQILNGRLNFGYCYPPLALLFALPGHVLFGDYRYSDLTAICASALFIGFLCPGRRPKLAAALFLFTPRVFYVLEQGWTDTFVVLCFTAMVFAACRAPRLLPYTIGLFLVAKQYTFIAAPLILWLLPGGPRQLLHPRFALKILLPAAVLTLPLALWNFRAFLWSCLTLQFNSPFRRDALSYLAYVVSKGGPQLPATIGFIAVIPALVRSTRRLRLRLRTGTQPTQQIPAAFAAATALCFGLFFSLNKQAFSNYYYFVIAAACTACAAAGGGVSKKQSTGECPPASESPRGT